MWERRSKVLLYTGLITSALIMSQMAFYVIHLVSGRPLTNNVFQVCSNWIQAYGLSWLVFILNVAAITTLLYLLLLCARQLYYSSMTHRNLKLSRHEQLTAQLNQSLYPANGKVMVVRHQMPIALTMGFLNPGIVLSTGLIDLLDEEELDALLQHERFHLISKDPLTAFLLSLSASVLWYVPILKWIFKQYKTAREVLADAYAIRETGRLDSLSSALLKLVRVNQAKPYSFTYASFAETSINYRIQHLINPEAPLKHRLPVLQLTISLLVVLGLTALFIYELA